MRLAFALLLSLALPASASEIVGKAVAIDGDTLRIDGQKVRICGIDAPEIGTRAGERSKGAMASLVNGRQVRCVRVGEGSVCDGRSAPTSHDRVVATCYVSGRDVAAEMVRQGHARDWRRYSGGAYKR